MKYHIIVDQYQIGLPRLYDKFATDAEILFSTPGPVMPWPGCVISTIGAGYTSMTQ